jgi:hypothetical protein
MLLPSYNEFLKTFNYKKTTSQFNMAYFLVQAVVVSAAIIAFIQARNWFQWRALRKWGEQHGCGNAPVVQNALPGGIERYSILFTGLKGTFNFAPIFKHCSPASKREF